MKNNLPFRIIVLLILLFNISFCEAQKKRNNTKKTQRKTIRFAPPTIADRTDEIKKAIENGQSSFYWHMNLDTSIAANVMFREEIEIRTDSVIFKRYFSKTNLDLSKRNYFFYEEENNKYYIEKKSCRYKISNDVISILSAATGKYEDYDFSPDNLFSPPLVNIKTKRQYKNKYDVPNRGSEEDMGQIMSYPK